MPALHQSERGREREKEGGRERKREVERERKRERESDKCLGTFWLPKIIDKL
jgi:hypothetical protein